VLYVLQNLVSHVNDIYRIKLYKIYFFFLFVWIDDRCYKSFNYLKTWSEARADCRARYADLFTWRNNADEQFIRPIVQIWATSDIFIKMIQLNIEKFTHPYIAWAGATIISLNRKLNI